MEKLCIFCVHGGFTGSGCGDYPDPATFDCAKGLLAPDIDNGSYDRHSHSVFGIEDWRKIIVTAQNCKSYKQVEA